MNSRTSPSWGPRVFSGGSAGVGPSPACVSAVSFNSASKSPIPQLYRPSRLSTAEDPLHLQEGQAGKQSAWLPERLLAPRAIMLPPMSPGRYGRRSASRRSQGALPDGGGEVQVAEIPGLQARATGAVVLGAARTHPSECGGGKWPLRPITAPEWPVPMASALRLHRGNRGIARFSSQGRGTGERQVELELEELLLPEALHPHQLFDALEGPLLAVGEDTVRGLPPHAREAIQLIPGGLVELDHSGVLHAAPARLRHPGPEQHEPERQHPQHRTGAHEWPSMSPDSSPESDAKRPPAACAVSRLSAASRTCSLPSRGSTSSSTFN